MGISGPAAFIAAQIQRDMTRDGTGSVDAVHLANAAGVGLETLEDSIAEAVAGLTFHHPETQFSGEVQGHRVVFERRPAARGLIAFVPAGGLVQPAAAEMTRGVAPEIAAKLIASAVPSGDRRDAAGCRSIIAALGFRPVEEVEAILGSALWTKKKQNIRFWAAATKRLKEAADDVAWAKRLVEAQDCLMEQEMEIVFMARMQARESNETIVESSLAGGLLPSRVKAMIEQRKREAQKNRVEGTVS